jgi:hypothetical protein
MEKIVKEHIESVKFFKKREETYFRVLPEETYKGFLQKPKYLPKRIMGPYDLAFHGKRSEKYTIAEKFGDDELYVEGNNIFFYPHIEIRMVSGKIHKKYFKTEDEAYGYINFNMNGINFITI